MEECTLTVDQLKEAGFVEFKSRFENGFTKEWFPFVIAYDADDEDIDGNPIEPYWFLSLNHARLLTKVRTIDHLKQIVKVLM